MSHLLTFLFFLFLSLFFLPTIFPFFPFSERAEAEVDMGFLVALQQLQDVAARVFSPQ